MASYYFLPPQILCQFKKHNELRGSPQQGAGKAKTHVSPTDMPKPWRNKGGLPAAISVCVVQGSPIEELPAGDSLKHPIYTTQGSWLVGLVQGQTHSQIWGEEMIFFTRSDWQDLYSSPYMQEESTASPWSSHPLLPACPMP